MAKEEDSPKTYFGAWAGRDFSSKDVVIRNSKDLGTITRKLDGYSVKQNFRHFTNGKGEHRILMIDPEKEERRGFHGGFYTWITDESFFKEFLVGMSKYDEIDEIDFNKIKTSLQTVCGIDITCLVYKGDAKKDDDIADLDFDDEFDI